MSKVTTISIPEEVRDKGHKAAEEMFGSKQKFSAYIAYLINKDCKKKGINNG